MPQQIALESPKINNLVSRIEMGEIKIPPLQRPFVWNIEQVLELLESIYHDYPVGSVLWWETKEALPSERTVAGFKLPNRPEQHPFYYVLDGQQRLSSLYGVFCRDRETIKQEPEYSVDAKIFDVSFELEKKIFVHDDQVEPGKAYFSMKKLFDTQAYSDSLMKATKENQEAIQDLYNKFSNYEVPIVITRKRDLAEVGVIFERVNNTGKRLDLFDLMVALTWTESFHLQKEFKGIHEILSDKNFRGIKNKIILQSLSGIIRKSSKISVITSLSGEEVRENIGRLAESLRKTVDYLSTELSVKSIQLLPHAHQIVPLCYFFSIIDTPTAKQKRAIGQWFWKTSFSDRYSASTDAHIDEDIDEFNKLAEEENPSVFTRLSYSVTAEQLRDTKFRRTNPYSRAFIVLLANANPKNLVNGVRIDTGRALSAFNQKEYHHVFPKGFLLDKSTNEDKINSLCNICLLPAGANKKISDKAPSKYFQDMPTTKKAGITESNLLPVKSRIYEEDDYDDFLRARSEKIIDFIEKELLN